MGSSSSIPLENKGFVLFGMHGDVQHYDNQCQLLHSQKQAFTGETVNAIEIAANRVAVFFFGGKNAQIYHVLEKKFFPLQDEGASNGILLNNSMLVTFPKIQVYDISDEQQVQLLWNTHVTAASDEYISNMNLSRVSQFTFAGRTSNGIQVFDVKKKQIVKTIPFDSYYPMTYANDMYLCLNSVCNKIADVEDPSFEIEYPANVSLDWFKDIQPICDDHHVVMSYSNVHQYARIVNLRTKQVSPMIETYGRCIMALNAREYLVLSMDNKLIVRNIDTHAEISSVAMPYKMQYQDYYGKVDAKTIWSYALSLGDKLCLYNVATQQFAYIPVNTYTMRVCGLKK